MSEFILETAHNDNRVFLFGLTLTCFFKSCGRLKLLPQWVHLCGFSGTWTRMWEVMWSRLTVVVRQLTHPQVKFKLLVDLRPT